MPTYEYRCTECGHEYERREGFDAPAVQRCPRCRGESRRVLYAPPILFKASGFYVTDNRKGGLAGSSAPSSGSNGGDGKNDFTVEGAPAAESKPASKPDDKPSEKSPEAAAAS